MLSFAFGHSICLRTHSLLITHTLTFAYALTIFRLRIHSILYTHTLTFAKLIFRLRISSPLLAHTMTFPCSHTHFPTRTHPFAYTLTFNQWLIIIFYSAKISTTIIFNIKLCHYKHLCFPAWNYNTLGLFHSLPTTEHSCREPCKDMSSEQSPKRRVHVTIEHVLEGAGWLQWCRHWVHRCTHPLPFAYSFAYAPTYFRLRAYSLSLTHSLFFA